MATQIDGIENEGISFDPAAILNANLVKQTPLEDKTGQVASKVIGNSKFPNVAYGSIQMALQREKYSSLRLQEHSREVKQHLKNIDLLLDLSAELSALPEGDTHTPSEKLKEIAARLKENGIEILKETGKKETGKIHKGECKALVSGQIDKERTSLQTIITTEIQPEINNVNAIMNILQQIIQSDARLKRKTCELPR